jgi:hypothetical protein
MGSPQSGGAQAVKGGRKAAIAEGDPPLRACDPSGPSFSFGLSDPTFGGQKGAVAIAKPKTAPFRRILKRRHRILKRRHTERPLFLTV